MTIIDKIAASIHAALDVRNEQGEVVEAFPFYYDTPETVNLRLDQAQYPCAFMHVVESGTADDTNGIIRERLLCQMVFTAPTVLDFDGLENERIIDPLKHAAFVWLQEVRRSSDLRLASIESTERLYATNDAILTAFAVTVRIEEVDGVSPCDLPIR